MKVPTRLSVLALALVLAACSQAPAPSAPKLTGTLIDTGAPASALGATLLTIVPSEITAVDLVEVMPGMWATPAGPVASDGSIEIPLPAAADIPAAVLVGADEMLVIGTTTCPLIGASSTARFTSFGFFGSVPVPVVALLYFTGTLPTLASDEVIDFAAADYSQFDYRSISWVYATEDSHVTAGTTGCVVAGTTISADLHLKSGWNQVAATFEVDEGTGNLVGLTYADDDTSEIYFNAPVGGVL